MMCLKKHFLFLFIDSQIRIYKLRNEQKNNGVKLFETVLIMPHVIPQMF